MAAEILLSKKTNEKVRDRDFSRTSLTAERIILVSAGNVERTIAPALSGELRHNIKVLELESCQLQNLLIQSFDLLIMECHFADDVVIEFCQNYRQEGGMAPILVILEEASTESRINMLDAGADDYLLQPLNIKELIVRIDTLLRRPPVLYKRLLQAGPVTLDTLTGVVKRDGEVVRLRPMEFNLLEFLMQHPNQVFTSQFLWQRIWKSTSRSYSDTVRTHIKTLRIKLDKSGTQSIISTVRGRGYRLESLEATSETILTDENVDLSGDYPD